MLQPSAKTSSLWEWVTIFGLTALAVCAAKILNLPKNWEDAIVYTTMVFVCVMLALKPIWGRRTFWTNLLLMFVGHLLLLLILLKTIQTGRHGFPKIFLIIAGMVEGLLLIAVLWRKTVAGEQRGPRKIFPS